MENNTVSVLLKDNDSDWSDIVDITLTAKERRILSDYASDDYDAVWDSLCNRIEDTYAAIPENWYIDCLIGS